MSKHANLYVTAVPTACIIIRLDNSNYLMDATLAPGEHDGEGSEFHATMPSLWGMIRIWWRNRKRRKLQTDPIAAMAIRRPAIEKPNRAKAPARAKSPKRP